jgi:hypothetical protein
MQHRQRIKINRFLSPLNPEETIQYVDHRLRQVGSSFAAVFEDQCRSLIFKLTSGCPRLINQLCDNALLIGLTEGRHKVTPKVLQLANETRETDRVSTTKSSRARTYRGRGAIKPLVVVAVSAVVLILLGIIATRSGWGVVNFQSVFQKIRAAIPFASGPPAPLVATNEELQAARKHSVGQSGNREARSSLSLSPALNPLLCRKVLGTWKWKSQSPWASRQPYPLRCKAKLNPEASAS